MKKGERIFVVGVYTEKGDWESNYMDKKRAYLYKTTAEFIQDNNDGTIKYKFGQGVHNGGEIGYDCFATENEAIERVNGLNKYFRENGCLAE